MKIKVAITIKLSLLIQPILIQVVHIIKHLKIIPAIIKANQSYLAYRQQISIIYN